MESPGSRLIIKMNWAVGDQKISMKEKNSFTDTRLQDVHGKSPHGSFGLKFSLLKFKSIKSLKYLKWNEKSLVFKRS